MKRIDQLLSPDSFAKHFPWSDGTVGGNSTGSSNSQDLFCGYGTEFNNVDRFYLDIGDKIHMLGADQTKMLSWLQSVGTESTDQISWSHIESENFSARDFDSNLVFTPGATSTEGVWTLQIAPQDWMAIETAAKGDTWASDNGKPLIYMTVQGAADAGTVDFSVVIEKGALYGRNERHIYDEDGGATNDLGVVQNHMVIASRAATTTTMGGGVGGAWAAWETECSNLPSGAGQGNFLYSDWDNGGTAKKYPVTVHVVTPESELQGMAQGSGLPNETRKFSRSVKGNVQITKTPFSISNTLKRVAMRGGNEIALRRLAKVIQHKDELERMIIFQGGGVEGVDWGVIATGDENPLTRTKGLGVGAANPLWGGDDTKMGFIKTKNADDSVNGSAFTLSKTAADVGELNAFIDALFDDLVDDPSDTKVMFCSQDWLTALSNLAGKRDNGGFVFGDNTVTNSLGIPGVRTLTGPNGTLRLVKLKHFRGRYKDYGLVVDFKNMRYRPLRPTVLKSNVATDEIDGQLDYYITEAGLKVMHESTHAIVKLVA